MSCFCVKLNVYTSDNMLCSINENREKLYIPRMAYALEVSYKVNAVVLV